MVRYHQVQEPARLVYAPVKSLVLQRSRWTWRVSHGLDPHEDVQCRREKKIRSAGRSLQFVQPHHMGSSGLEHFQPKLREGHAKTGRRKRTRNSVRFTLRVLGNLAD